LGNEYFGMGKGFTTAGAENMFNAGVGSRLEDDDGGVSVDAGGRVGMGVECSLDGSFLNSDSVL
jgi:hypothetical protein